MKENREAVVEIMNPTKYHRHLNKDSYIGKAIEVGEVIDKDPLNSATEDQTDTSIDDIRQTYQSNGMNLITLPELHVHTLIAKYLTAFQNI